MKKALKQELVNIQVEIIRLESKIDAKLREIEDLTTQKQRLLSQEKDLKSRIAKQERVK